MRHIIEKEARRLTSGPVLGLEEQLKNIPIYHIPFRPLSEQWDHGHCIFCWAKFYLHEECLQEGYCTQPQNSRDAVWICPECYADFKEMFGWTLQKEPTLPTEIIARVRHMEALFDRALETRVVPEKLKAYYSGGQWLRDYEADSRGELPPDLRRGVLSQDGVWNLLTQTMTRDHPDTGR